jgi:hypothetical protein
MNPLPEGWQSPEREASVALRRRCGEESSTTPGGEVLEDGQCRPGVFELGLAALQFALDVLDAIHDPSDELRWVDDRSRRLRIIGGR